jgi:hypothetical protein
MHAVTPHAPSGYLPGKLSLALLAFACLALAAYAFT